MTISQKKIYFGIFLSYSLVFTLFLLSVSEMIWSMVQAKDEKSKTESLLNAIQDVVFVDDFPARNDLQN